MRDDWPPTFLAELRRPGCNPYWLLKITTTGGVYNISDNDRYITPLSVQAYGAAKSFGELKEGISNALGEFQVAEYTIELLLGVLLPTHDIAYLADAGLLDDAQADLYLGLAGISDPPQLITPGWIRDFGVRTDTVLPVMIQDTTITLERAFIGRKVSASDYPNAAPADVGKMLPIPFGVVKKIPAVCLDYSLQTTLKSAAAIGAQTLYVSDVTGITAGKTFLLDSEQVVVAGVGADYMTTNAPTTAAHNQGATCCELKTLKYCGSDRALVAAVDKVWLRKDNLDLDITAFTTRYNGIVPTPDGLCLSAALAVGSTPQNIGWGAFNYVINTTLYSKAANAVGTVLLEGSVPAAKYAAVSLDINSSGVITQTIKTNIVASSSDGLLSSPNLRILLVGYHNSLQCDAFSYRMTEVVYNKAAVYIAPLGGQTVPQNKYAASSIDINAVGVISYYGAPGNETGYDSAAAALGGLLDPDLLSVIRLGTIVVINTTAAFTWGITSYDGAGVTTVIAESPLAPFTPGDGYSTAALALAALPAVAAGSVRLGWATIAKSDGVFALGTTALNAANVTTVITQNPAAYSANPPISGSYLSGYANMGMATISAANMIAIATLMQVSLTDPGHLHSITTMQTTEGTTNTPQLAEGPTSGYQTLSAFGIFPNSAPGNRTAVNMTVNAVFSASFTYDAAINLCNDSNGRVLTLWSWNGSGARQVSYTFQLTSAYLGYNRVEACIGASNIFIHVELQGAQRTITHITDNVQDSSTDITLNGGAMQQLFGAGNILFDMTADCGTFETACNWILDNYGLPPLQIVGALAVTACKGVIDDYKAALYWLNYLAFQAGAWFMMPTGQAKLVSRNLGAPVRTISACVADNTGRRLLTQTRTDLVDVIDKVVVLYNRDWTKSKGADAYNGATAIGGTGVRERPELFQFDFVTLLADANILRDLYLNYCKNRHRVITFDNPIEQADIESGDAVTLGSLGNATGVVIPAEHAPGNMDTADNIKLTVLV